MDRKYILNVLFVIQLSAFIVMAIWFFTLGSVLNHRIQQNAQYDNFLETQLYTEQVQDYLTNPYSVPKYLYVLFALALGLLGYWVMYLYDLYQMITEVKNADSSLQG